MSLLESKDTFLTFLAHVTSLHPIEGKDPIHVRPGVWALEIDADQSAQSSQLLQNPPCWGGRPRLLACYLTYIYSPRPSLGSFFLKDKCSVALEVYETQCTRFSKSKKYWHTISRKTHCSFCIEEL